jgi:predicted transcriptional regulator
MDTAEEVIAFEKRVREQGLSLGDVLRMACVDRSTWTRWKSGTTTPRLDNWRAVERAADALAAAGKAA